MTPEEASSGALAAEHAAVYLFGVFAARTSQSAEPTLFAALDGAYAAHVRRRDRLAELRRADGGGEVGAEIGYVLPTPSRTPEQIRSAALAVESRTLPWYADLAGATTGELRALGLDALVDAATRVLDFGGRAEPFPGLPELSQP